VQAPKLKKIIVITYKINISRLILSTKIAISRA